MAASIQDGGLPLKILEETANEGAPYGFAVFNEDGQELIDLFNAGLANIIANGKYEEIVAKYLGEDTAAASVAAFGAGEAEEAPAEEPAEEEAATEEPAEEAAAEEPVEEAAAEDAAAEDAAE